MSLQAERIEAMNEAIASLPEMIAQHRDETSSVQLMAFTKIHQHARRVWEMDVLPKLGGDMDYETFAAAIKQLMKTLDPARIDAGTNTVDRPDWMNDAIKQCVDALLRVVNEIPGLTHGHLITELQNDAGHISRALNSETVKG